MTEPRRVALAFRGDRRVRGTITLENSRLAPIGQALAEAGLVGEAAVFTEDMVDEVRDQLLAVDAVLVWVDPVTDGRDRTVLDALLREVAANGVLVSAHPDTILAMGTKEVLYRTRDLGWGTDTDLYTSVEDFITRFPGRLAHGAVRVLKQHRGNAGIGVWRVQTTGSSTSAPTAETPVMRQDHVPAGDT